jgi:hypothetical protein
MGTDVVLPLVAHKVVDASSFGQTDEDVSAGVTAWLKGELDLIANDEYRLYLECVEGLLTQATVTLGQNVEQSAFGQLPIEEISKKTHGKDHFRYARLMAFKMILTEATPLLQESEELIDQRVGSSVTVEASSVEQLQENESKAIAEMGAEKRDAILAEAKQLLSRCEQLSRNAFPGNVLEELDGKKKKLSKIVKKFERFS